jgi:hypothetical protein
MNSKTFKMKAKLIKIDKDNYTLFDEKGIPIGTTPNVLSNNTFSKLSKQNCDEIFGVVDVEKLADEITKEYATLTPKAFKRGVVSGFNKAMDLNEDKVFTLENMFDLYAHIVKNGIISGEEVNKFIQSLQQPIEIEVEIEMCDSIGISDLYTPDNKSKLDSSGHLILKKI